MIVGCYTTHLYCDFPDDSWDHRGNGEFPGPGFAEFNGQNERSTRRQAKAAGWFFRGTRALCPHCIRQGRQLPKETP